MCRIVGLMLLAWAAVPAAFAQGQPLLQEYFLRQEPNESVLIRIDGMEAQYTATVMTIDGELVIRSTLPGSRVAPIFQYIDETPLERQLDLRIVAPAHTNRTRFDIGLNRIDVRDDRSARLAQGYQWLSFALETPAADTAANWSIKVNSALNASRLFRDFGMEEMWLWSSYYVAELTGMKLGDVNSALSLAGEILSNPGSRRRPDIQLATRQLRLALLMSRVNGDLGTKATNPVQAAADESARLAASLGMQYERAAALNRSATDLAARGQNQAALARFQAALQVVESIESADLATEIRERMVEIHGQEGDVAATSEVLQAIESQLTRDGASDQLAQNLLAQGQLFNRTYRYEDAAAVLRQALDYEHNSVTRTQVRLALAVASYERGDLDTAFAQARAAVVNPDSGGYRRRTPVLDVGSGVALLANVFRARGEFSAMREARRAQGRYHDSGQNRTLWAWETAQDGLAQGGKVVGPWLERVIAAPASPGINAYRALAQLQLCALEGCAGSRARSAYEQIAAMNIPRHHAEADRLWARVLKRQGQTSAALVVMEGLIDQMLVLSHELPGVLGHWHWRHGAGVAAMYLDELAASGDVTAFLLGLAKVRWWRAAGERLALPADLSGNALDTDANFALLARTEWPGRNENPELLADQVAEILKQAEAEFARSFPFLNRQGVDVYLKTLAPGEVVLDYHFSDTTAWAVVAGRDGVRQRRLRGSNWNQFLSESERNASLLGGAAFDQLMSRLAGRLLQPLQDMLGTRVYLNAVPELSGVPMSALQVDDAAVSKRREIVRLVSFPARLSPGHRLKHQPAPTIFVAGNPQDYRSGFLSKLDTAGEMRAVMNRFVGPGLNVIQGTSLQADEFMTDAFRDAALVHFAMPGFWLASQPFDSYLELSEARRGSGRSRLGPRDMVSWEMDAWHVFLSQFARNGLADGDESGRPPVVSELLKAGAGAVTASLWRGSDEDASGFMASFYEALDATRDLPAALRIAREKARVEAVDAESRDWARYELYLD